VVPLAEVAATGRYRDHGYCIGAATYE